MIAVLPVDAEAVMGAGVVTVNDALDGHVALDIQCLDRIYLNAYVPRLQGICDRLGPGTIGVFIQRWLARLPFRSPTPTVTLAGGGNLHAPGRGLPHHRLRRARHARGSSKP